MTPDRPELSVVVLCFAAGESIHGVLDPLCALLDKAGVRYELVLVANYWPDQPDLTREVVRRFAESRKNAVVIDEEKQGGMGWDLRSGLAATTGEIIVAIDGDAQNPVADVLRMFELLRRTGADVGKGVRTNRADGLYRRIVSSGYNMLFRLLFGTWNLWDINGKPKGLTRRAYDRMSLKSNDWFVDAEIVLAARRAGMTIVELPVIFLENKERSSFVRFSTIWEFARNMARYRLRRHR
jgi:glycosyltransferase involved in cell wall biosynthesis